MISKLLQALILALSLATLGLACSIPGMPPSAFNKTQFVFAGEVVGYVMSDKPLDKPKQGTEAATGPTAGLVVAVKDVLFTPQPAKKTYEVYRFGLGASCDLYGVDVEYFKSRYPIGRKVQVYAGDAIHLADSSKSDTGRLEISYTGDDRINLISETDKTVRNTLDSLPFDYRKYREDAVGDPWFELTKDMLRFESAKDADRTNILERLTYYPSDRFMFDELFKLNTRFPDEFDKWIELAQKRIMKPEEFKRLRELQIERQTKNLK